MKTQELLAQRREPAIWFCRTDTPVSGSRWGGRPSLPDGIDWPIHPGSGRPLHFITQVDLSAVPTTPMPGCPFKARLPPGGMLFFFFDHAMYWDAEDVDGEPRHSRVVYTEAAGADRDSPDDLPVVGYDPQEPGGEDGGEKLLPVAPLQAQAIDTFWDPRFFAADGHWAKSFECGETEKSGADWQATWRSIVRAAGEAGPITMPLNGPSLAPGHFVDRFGEPGAEPGITKFQMFGPATQTSLVPGEPRRDRSRILLLEVPIYAHQPGCLQYWMSTEDFEAARFERAHANAHFD